MALYKSTKDLQDERNTKFETPDNSFYTSFFKRMQEEFAKTGKITNRLSPSRFPLGREIPKSYQRRLGPFFDPIVVDEEYMAQRQSGTEQLLYVIPRVATKVASELAQMPGYANGAISWATTGFKPEEIGRMIDNEWIQSIQSLEDKVKDRLPVYVKEAVKSGSLLTNILSPAFWATEGADGIGFLLAMLAPGQILKAGQVGEAFAEFTKMGKALSRSKVFGKALSTQIVANQTNGVLATAINTLFESSAEAGETYREALVKFEDPELAGRAAVSNLKKNFSILLLSNALEQQWIFKQFTSPDKIAANSLLGRFFY